MADYELKLPAFVCTQVHIFRRGKGAISANIYKIYSNFGMLCFVPTSIKLAGSNLSMRQFEKDYHFIQLTKFYAKSTQWHSTLIHIA